MRQEILNQKTKRLLKKIEKTEIVKNFYLAGGTALALQIRHRKSFDLDWFSPKKFLTKDLKNKLKSLGKLRIDEEHKDTLNCLLEEVKLSFFGYPYKLLFPFVKCEYNLKLADLRDIACMKIDAVSSRGYKKDFIDIYFLLKKFSLKEILELFDKKYQGIEYNHLHILKSLTYFETAENQPMPLMLRKISWEEVKNEISKKVKNYLEKIS